MDSQDPASREETSKFSAKSATAEDMLKSSTVGLVRLSDFRKRRAEVFEQKEKESHEKSLALKEHRRAQHGGAAGKEGEEDDGYVFYVFFLGICSIGWVVVVVCLGVR